MGNHKPIIKGNDDGMWRRLLLIPFTAQITTEEQIPSDKMLEKLETDVDSFLSWAIQGYIEYKKVGLVIPEIVLEATREYRDDSDITLDFLNECCEEEKGETVYLKDLYLAYTFYCDKNKEYKLKNRAFYARLEGKGFITVQAERGLKKFKNLKLNTEYETLLLNYLTNPKSNDKPYNQINF